MLSLKKLGTANSAAAAIAFLAFAVANAVVLRHSITWRLENGVPRGFIRRTYTAPDGQVYKYALFVPYELSHIRRPPVIMFLNGWGDSGNDGTTHVRGPFGDAIWESKGIFPFIAFMPQSRINRGWEIGGQEATFALMMLERVCAEFDADRDRVYLTGASTGGEAVWRFAAAHAEKFSAIVPVSATIDVSDEDINKIADSRLPVWQFAVDRDARVAEAARENHRRLIHAGASPILTEIDTTNCKWLPFHDAWSFAYRNQALFSWLLRQSRYEKSGYQNKCTSALNNGNALRWTVSDSDGTPITDDGVIETDCTMNIGPARLVSPEVFSSCEMHVEFQITQGDCFDVWLRSIFDFGNCDGIRCQICTPKHGAGRVTRTREENVLGVGNARAQRAFLSNRWNNLHVVIANEQLRVWLNEWLLFDVDIASSGSSRGHLAIETPAGNRMLLRNLQYRAIGGGE